MITHPKYEHSKLRLDNSYNGLFQHGIKVLTIRASCHVDDQDHPGRGWKMSTTRCPSEYIKTGKYQGIGKDHPCFHRKLDFFLEPYVEQWSLKTKSGVSFSEQTIQNLLTYWQARYPNEIFEFGPGLSFWKYPGTTSPYVLIYQPRSTYLCYYDTTLEFSGLVEVWTYVHTINNFCYWLKDYYAMLNNQVGYACTAIFAGGTESLYPLTVHSTSSGTGLALKAAALRRAKDPLDIHSNFEWLMFPQQVSTNYYTLDIKYPDDSLSSGTVYQAVKVLDNCLTKFNDISAQNTVPKNTWGALAMEAIKSMKATDVNTIGYIRDLKTTFSEVKSTLQLIADPTNPKKWAAAWLNFRYGTRLTVSDTEELIKAAKAAYQQYRDCFGMRFQFARSQSSEDILSTPSEYVTMKRQFWYKVYYKPDTKLLKQLQKLLTDWGIFPTYSTTWDLIPLSFVADWIANFSEVWEILDAYEYEQLIRVLGITYTYRDCGTIYVAFSDLPFKGGNADCVVYNRQISKALHHYRWTLNWGSGNGINILDAGALLSL